MIQKLLRNAVVAAALLAAAQPGRADDDVASFYKDRTVTVMIGFGVGGGYDSYARLLAEHMGRHIPGHPTLVAQNMPGAGSLKVANYLYAAAPQDGSVFGTVARGMGMEPLLGGAPFDSRKFTWIGSITDEVSLCASWHTSPVKSWDDLMTTELTVGGNGAGSDPDVFALALKNIFGAKLKLVTGYPGSSDIALALERGEVQGRCGWSLSSLKSLNPTWLPEKKINLLVLIALKKSAELPDLPVVMDYARTDAERQTVRLILARQIMGRPFLAPPGIPEDRKAALRTAFDETMADPEFRAAAEKIDLEVNPVTGSALDTLLAELYATPPEVIAKAMQAIRK